MRLLRKSKRTGKERKKYLRPPSVQVLFPSDIGVRSVKNPSLSSLDSCKKREKFGRCTTEEIPILSVKCSPEKCRPHIVINLSPIPDSFAFKLCTEVVLAELLLAFCLGLGLNWEWNLVHWFTQKMKTLAGKWFHILPSEVSKGK